MNKEAPDCRFCGSAGSSQKVKGAFVFGGTPEHKFWECSECGMIYLFPVPTVEEESAFYGKEFEKFMENRAGGDTKQGWNGPEEHVRINKAEADRRIKLLKTAIKPGMRVLEVGCSSGFMLLALKALGCEPVGIEPSGGFLDFIRSKGIPVYGSYEELQKKGEKKFDLVIHYYVLEHVRNPVEFLSQYIGLLSDGGKMIFEIPAAEDPLISLYRVKAFDRFYWSIAHHWYFNRKSISNVLDKLGHKYKIYPEQRYDLSNHIVWMLEGVPGGKGRYSGVFSAGLDQKYKDDLKNNWHCDTIIGEVLK